jgi:ribosome biogenesis protein ERB1
MPPTLIPSFNAELDPSLDIVQEQIKVFRKSDLPPIEADYSSDSSDESVINTVGNVPLEWYSDYPHIGYDIDGKKILKPAKGDELEEFLASMDDPESRRSVYDDVEKKDVALTKEQAEMMKRIMKNEFPDADFDPYQVNYYF